VYADSGFNGFAKAGIVSYSKWLGASAVSASRCTRSLKFLLRIFVYMEAIRPLGILLSGKAVATYNRVHGEGG
jgi:hypothetical protein